MVSLNLKFVNTLRGLAILGVLIIHTAHVGIPLSDFQVNIVKQGAKGVQLFFIASAFTLFISLSRRSNEPKNYVAFCLRRLFRIAPMYWLGIAFYSCLNRIWLQQDAIKSIILNLVFLHGFDPSSFNTVVPGGWSIAVEMTFYLFVPFLFRFIISLSYAVWFTFFTIMLHCLIMLILLNYQPSLLNNKTNYFYVNHYLINSMPVFGMGFILFYMCKKPFQFVQLLPLVVSILLGGFLLHKMQLDYIYLLLSLVFMALAYMLSKDKLTFLNHPLLGHIGKISFSLYLVHFAVLRLFISFKITDFASNPLLSYSLRLVCLLILAVPLATLFYTFIEVPFQNLGKRIIRHSEKSNNLETSING